MSGTDKKRAFPYYSEVQGFELQRRRLEDDPSRPRHFITEAGMGYRYEP